MDLLNPPRLDKKAVKKFFNRAAKSYDNAAILQEEVLNRLLQRLQYMRHRPETLIDIGCGTGQGLTGLRRQYPRARAFGVDIAEEMLRRAARRRGWFEKKRLIAADMECLPFPGQQFDLLFSSLALQWCNDLAATLEEFARISKPGALILFSSFGPGTLRELDESWQAFDPYPHVHRFVDMHDVGDAMLAAGFAQPVVDAEVIRLEYREFRELLADLKNIGASNADVSRRRGLTTPARLERLEAEYRARGFDNDRFVASYEVVYGHAWSPAA